ncbi:hypothetical protein O181_030157 [Austropuccinia psidii MF-1]|uniref:Uncharacterized protein n=1 Tax=Austropuccinia psidii MF-1 TaxID=1389203 RepID=A0A9Q3CY18_9BASI|nr:hypothetical protein [Austropuccinia psidii MF-1]
MKPQPHSHVMDNPYHPEDIKPDVILANKTICPSQYHDGDNMSYSEKESLKQLPEASSWPKFSGTGEYNHMELIEYIDGLFIDVQSIPDCMLAFGIQRQKKFIAEGTGHGGRVKSSKSTEILLVYCRGSCHVKMTSTLVEITDKPRERVAEVAKKKNSFHNCGSTDNYANNCPKEKKKVYAIEKVQEEESPTEDSETDSMGDAIREQSDEDKDPREEFLVDYQEEKLLEIQEIQLEAGMPQHTANKNLCKHTQDVQMLVVTPAKRMA